MRGRQNPSGLPSSHAHNRLGERALILFCVLVHARSSEICGWVLWVLLESALRWHRTKVMSMWSQEACMLC